MQINPIARTGGVNPYNNQEAKSKELHGNKGKRRDEVQISAEAKELLGAHNKAGATGASKAKVQELKGLVSSGTYHIEANKIAEKLLPYLGQ